ncbi:MAG: polymer-forming cytoskeletal protein [Candidatus Omnitrophica bacterium]|nr:polymer-forming cytoskeletal protein [Candidatus Omnitrophota bacterium]MDD5488410.1 polymer-forming cytoskeletal protein [Candidatus Omnitrophota bacterium]
MRKKLPEKQNAEEKFLDVSASMQGTLRFDDPVNLRINGKFEGTLDTKGQLMVGNRASIDANITGESISIAGKVTGNIKAVKGLKLESTAHLTGEIETPSLSVSEGAVINGNIRMTGGNLSDNQNRGDWMTVDQLAKYLEVDGNKIYEWANKSLLPGTKEGGEWIFERSKVDQWIAEGKVKA